jgi:2Fe-2S ferredoxin
LKEIVRANCALSFQPEGPVCLARAGDTLLDAALDAGIEIPHECGGNCACTSCHVLVIEGMACLSPMEPAEADRLDMAENRTSGSRLSCQALLRAGAVVVRLAAAQDV